MSVEITKFVNANISIKPTGVGLGNFGILGFLTDESGILTNERARAYSSLSEVLSDWSTSTEVYKAAAAFYGQTPSPTDFVVLSVYGTNQPAYLVGGGSDTLAEIQALGSDDLALEVNGVVHTITVNFNQTTFDNVADAISQGLTAQSVDAQVIHDGSKFVVSTLVATGNSATIEYSIGTVSDALGLSQHQAITVYGINAETPVEALGQAIDKNIDFTAVVTHKKYRDVVGQPSGLNTEDIADFCEGTKKIFCNTTNNLTSLDAQVTSDIGSILKAKSLQYTITTLAKNYNQYPSASVFGRAASVNFEGISTTITLNLKRMPSITAEDLTTAQLDILRDKNINVVVQIGKDATAYTEGRMASGSWLDSVHGLLWLENRIETDMFNLLYTSNTDIPYTPSGVNTLIATLRGSLEQALNNGLIEAGFLDDGTYLPNGYGIKYVEVQNVSTADKTNRSYKGLKFIAIGAGAIHDVVIDGEFSE